VAPPVETEDVTWQRLDKWLWCARLAKARSTCTTAIERGGFRLNRQPTEKPHAKLRAGDVLTFPWQDQVRVWRVLALAPRRGPPEAARALYEDLSNAPES
jgi:ribosome-associated heat shock protein Hsp15